MTTATVKAGDVFYSSWGYDQTNVNFFGVTRVSATGKTAWFVEITSTHLGSSERMAGNAAKCRHCGNGVRKLVKVDGSAVYRHVETGRTECKFYGYRAERLREEGRVLHAAVDEFKRRLRTTGDGRACAAWTDYASMYANDRETHYETPTGAGH